MPQIRRIIHVVRLGIFPWSNEMMKSAVTIAISLMFFCLTPSLAAQSSSRFEDYEVSVYTGAIQRPKWIHHVGGDEWRDNLGKLVDPPEVNFAGKYFVVV